MIKINIIKNSEITNSATFETQELADAWLNNEIANNSFGLPERPEMVPDESGFLIPSGNTLPAEYGIQTLDITAEIVTEQLKAKSVLAVQLGAEIMAEIRHINVMKNMDAATFTALMNDTYLEKLERHLWSGSFQTAKAMVNAYTGTHYTSEDKTAILALLDSAIAKVG